MLFQVSGRRFRRRVRLRRQEQHHVLSRRRIDIGTVNSGVGGNVAVAMFYDRQPRTLRRTTRTDSDSITSTSRRIFFDLSRKFPGTRRRHDVGKVDVTPLRL